MSSYKILIVIALVLFVTIPSGLARAQAVPTLISASVAGSGTAVIVDGVTRSNTVIFSLTGVTIPAEDEAYEGWLISDDGSTKLSTGILNVSADGSVSHTFTSLSDENFIAKYDTVVITVEPADDTDPGPSDDVAFMHQIPPAAMTHIRHLLTEWPAGADMGILGNLEDQLGVAIGHVSDAAKSNNVDDLRDSMQDAIDAIEGDDGVLAHADNRKHAGFAAGEAPGDDVIAEHAALVDKHGANAEAWATLARDQAEDVLGVDSLVGAQTLAGVVGSLLQDALDGTNDGSQLAAEQAYIEGQLMATYTLPSPAPPPAPAILPVVGDSTVPLFAQIGLVLGVLLLSAGGFVLLRGRRSRSVA